MFPSDTYQVCDTCNEPILVIVVYPLLSIHFPTSNSFWRLLFLPYPLVLSRVCKDKERRYIYIAYLWDVVNAEMPDKSCQLIAMQLGVQFRSRSVQSTQIRHWRVAIAQLHYQTHFVYLQNDISLLLTFEKVSTLNSSMIKFAQEEAGWFKHPLHLPLIVRPQLQRYRIFTLGPSQLRPNKQQELALPVFINFIIFRLINENHIY